MPSKWKYPREGTAWSTCTFCNQDYPSSQVWFNPRFGFQCFLCWDGLIQRDQIQQPIFPGEGTRRTLGPVTNTLLEGTGATSAAGLEPTYNYFLQDRVTGLVYEVHLPPFYVTGNGLIVYFTASIATLTLTTTGEPVNQGIFISNGYDVYVASGVLRTEPVPFLAVGIEFGICDFGEIPSLCTVLMTDLGSGLTYSVDFSENPPTLTEIVTLAPTFDAVQINSGWFLISLGAVIFSTTTPPTGNIFFNNCIDITVDADTGEQTNPPPGGGGGGGVTPVPPIVVECPEMVVTDLDVDFTAIAPVGAIVTNYHWDFGDGSQADTGTTTTVSHGYATTGTYTVTLTVTAASGVGVSHGCEVEVFAPIECVIDQPFLTELFDHPYCDTPEHFLTELFNT